MIPVSMMVFIFVQVLSIRSIGIRFVFSEASANAPPDLMDLVSSSPFLGKANLFADEVFSGST